MTAPASWLYRACLLAGTLGALVIIATAAEAAPCNGALSSSGAPTALCGPNAFAAFAQLDEDDEDDEDEDEGFEEMGDVDLADDNADRDFEYDEDEGSFLVDIENCEPGKFWMMDLEDGVPLPCK